MGLMDILNGMQNGPRGKGSASLIGDRRPHKDRAFVLIDRAPPTTHP